MIMVSKMFALLFQLSKYPCPGNWSNELSMLENTSEKIQLNAIKRIALKCKNDAEVLKAVQNYLESK
jgi:hypothetical protein